RDPCADISLHIRDRCAGTDCLRVRYILEKGTETPAGRPRDLGRSLRACCRGYFLHLCNCNKLWADLPQEGVYSAAKQPYGDDNVVGSDPMAVV
ncbi:hypothetical protein GGI11_007802, partial [Coemansia sp. RSA 2049]